MERSKVPVARRSPVNALSRRTSWSRLAGYLSWAMAGSVGPRGEAGWRRSRGLAAAGAVLVAVPLAIVAVAGPAAQARPDGSLARAAYGWDAGMSQARGASADTRLARSGETDASQARGASADTRLARGGETGASQARG